MGSSGINGSPNSEENVGVGSVTPTSVPGILAVKPVTKWYMAASAVRREDGRQHAKGVAGQEKSTTLGWCYTLSPRVGNVLHRYATRVLCVIETSS